MMNYSTRSTFTAVIGTALLLSCLFPIAHSVSVAYDRGERLANQLWDDKKYSCRNIESYRRTAERNLFPKCEDEFDINSMFEEDCQEGVEDTIQEKESTCVFDTNDCKKYGRSIGLGVAARVCSTKSARTQTVFSDKCIRTATNTCIDTATNEVENFMDEGTCGDETRLTRKMEKTIKKLCEEEVKKFATGA